MAVSVPPPSTPPAYVEVSRYPLPLSLLVCHSPEHQTSDLQLRKQPALAFFFFFSPEVLDLWPGLVCSPSCHYWLAFIGSRAKCLFSLHCWEWEMGGTLVYLWVGPLRCVRRKNCPLHTIDWQARQEPRHRSSRTLDSSRSFSFLKHNTLKSYQPSTVLCRVVWRITIAKEGSTSR